MQEPANVLQARDGVHPGGSGSGVQGAIYKLDQQFLYLLSHISSLIGPAKYALADDCQQNYLKTKTFGWSILGGGLLDTASDFFGNFRSAEDVLTMADVGFSYVYNNAYGIGFGAPFLLPTYNPSCSYQCGANDFLGVVSNYGLSNGVVSVSSQSNRVEWSGKSGCEIIFGGVNILIRQVFVILLV